jgi:hypothetical protein
LPSLRVTNKRQLALAICLAIWVAVYFWRVALPAARATTNGFAAYYTAAHLLAHNPQELGRSYEDDWFAEQIARVGIEGVYDVFKLQPPTMSLVMLPLVCLPPAEARLVWIFTSLLFLLAGLALLARALGLPARWGLWGLPLCLFFAPVTENLRNGQAYLLIFFFLCLFYWLALKKKDVLAGTVLGMMLVLKTMALWLWPLLLVERRWRILLSALGVAVVLAAVSLPVIGLETWLAYARLLPRLATMPERYVTAYQTWTSLVGHLFVFDARWNPAPLADWPLLARLLNLAVLAVTFLFSLRWGQLGSNRLEVRALTLALYLSLVVVNAPVGEGHHYAMVLPSLLVAFWWAWKARLDWKAWAALIVASLMVGLPLPYRASRLQAGWLALLAYPRVYGSYVLWAWLGWALCQVRKKDHEPVPGRG